jgi:copper homeostasis protein
MAQNVRQTGENGVKLEVCVEDLAGIVAACDGGADRIELCAGLALGGLTPCAALMASAVQICSPAGIPIHAMVRPRAGDFAYDESEMGLALAAGEALIAAGADGLVFGAARDGRLDTAALRLWVDRFADRTARSGAAVELTLHRAIDTVDDPVAAIEIAVALGFDRILSSGGEPAASLGAATLRRMVDRAGGRCRIAAGSGITPANVTDIIASTGVDEVHASASRTTGQPDPKLVALGFASGPRKVTDAALVRQLKEKSV